MLGEECLLGVRLMLLAMYESCKTILLLFRLWSKSCLGDFFGRRRDYCYLLLARVLSPS